MTLPKAATVRWQRDYLKRFARELTDNVIDDLLRRGAEPTVDAWSRGTDETGRHPQGGVSRPTEAAVMARNLASVEPGHETPDVWAGPPPDRVLEMLEELFSELVEAVGHVRAIERRAAAIFGREDAARDGKRSDSAEELEKHRNDCRACTRPITGVGEDMPRKGLCNACRVAFDRARPELEERVGVEEAAQRALFCSERPAWQGDRSKVAAS